MLNNKSNKWKKFFRDTSWLVVLILFFVISIHINRNAIAYQQSADDAVKKIGLVGEVLDIIQEDFADTGFKTTDLIYGAIEGMLKVLKDPHTRFMDPKDSKEMRVETEGKFGGLGIVIGIRDEHLTVISPIEGTPAFKAGLEPDDRIVKINGETTLDISLQDAVSKLRGKPNTKVTITISRENMGEPFDVTITRAIIKIKSVKFTEIPPDILYVRITQFSSNTTSGVEEAIRYAENNKDINKIIVDLRNNPGGLLSAAVGVSEIFLKPGDVIVSTRGRKEDQNMVYKSHRSGNHNYYPLAVLVNGGSASASEIVSGAIQDHKRGILIGKKTYGKASVQTVKTLIDKSTIAITTAKYYTPANRLIHKKGIMPDMVVDNDIPDEKDLKSLQSLFKKKTLHDFAKEHEGFMTDIDSDTYVDELSKKLKEDKLGISKNILRRYIISELARRYDKHVYYDLKSDNQMREAVNILHAAQILNQTK